MSVTTTSNRISHVSAGETTFAYDFLVDDDDWITVYHNGVLQTTGYSVTGVGNNAGGTVIHGVAVTAGVTVTIVRAISPTQLIAIPGGATKFPAESVETALDKLTMLIQQGEDNTNLGIRWPITTPSTVTGELFDPTDSDNWGAALVLNGTGTAIEAHPITGGGDIDVLTTAGDMVYYTGSSAARLGKGGLFYHLTMDPNTNLPGWRPPTQINVAEYFSPDGINDDYADLQALFDVFAADTSRVFNFEPGKVYNLSRSLVIFGNTELNGNGATLQALSGGFTGTAAANTSSLVRNYYHGYNNIPAVVSDYNDENITIRNFHMTFNGEAAAGQGNICIWLRWVDRYLIHNCTFGDSGDPIGILACRRGLTDHCYAEAFINAGYDHWDGCTDCGVTNSVLVSTLTDTAQGIQFTGTGSLGENRDTVGCYAIGNKVYGIRHSTAHTASAIIFNANDADSSVQNCVSAFNYIEDSDLGVVFSGAGSNNISIGDTLNNVTYAPLFMQHANSDSPNYCRFLDTTLIDCDNTSGTALVTLTGVEPEVRGLKVINSGSAPYPYIVNIASTATNAAVTIQKAPDGDTGRISDSGTTSKIYNEAVAYTPALSFGGATTGITYTSRSGTYTRYGDVIHVRGTIVVNDNGSASGGAAISLPVAGATATLNGLATCWLADATGLTSAVTGAITTGGTVIALYDHGATGAAAITESNIINGTTISFDACYRVAL